MVLGGRDLRIRFWRRGMWASSPYITTCTLCVQLHTIIFETDILGSGSEQILHIL